MDMDQSSPAAFPRDDEGLAGKRKREHWSDGDICGAGTTNMDTEMKKICSRRFTASPIFFGKSKASTGHDEGMVGKRKLEHRPDEDLYGAETTNMYTEMKKMRFRSFTRSEAFAKNRLAKDVSELFNKLAHHRLLSVERAANDPFSLYLQYTRFTFLLTVPDTFPFSPPKVLLCDLPPGLPHTSHAVIAVDRSVNLPILDYERWSPCVGLENVVIEIKSLCHHLIRQDGAG